MGFIGYTLYTGKGKHSPAASIGAFPVHADATAILAYSAMLGCVQKLSSGIFVPTCVHCVTGAAGDAEKGPETPHK